MKKRKEYMPRRGMRFDRRHVPGSPAGGFIGADIEVFDFTGSVQPSLTERDGTYRVATGAGEFVLTGTTDISDSVGPFGTAFETRLLNASVLGSSVGGLGYANTIVSTRTGSIPAWTNKHLGHNAAFVIPTLSSSYHESQVLNAYRSGTEPLETTAVPASAALYYSKQSRFNTITVKKSASYFDTVGPAGYSKGVNGFFPPAKFVPGSGSLLTLMSSSIEADMSVAAGTHGSIIIDVPVSGKLVDISVWIELHHQSGSVPIMPLGSLGLGLTPPNLKWGSGHPMQNFNDESIAYFSSTGLAVYAADTFILWEGPGALMLDQRVYVTGPNHVALSDVREKYPGWDRDMSMRTIFNDGAPINNPRHNIPFAVGSGSYIGSPNAALGINNAWGMAVDWTGSTGSPPAGWLSGPGGVAAVNEWPTTGSNRGAERIKPLYPLLDPIEVTIPAAPPGGDYPSQFFGQAISPEKFIGTRPGLRGTEISGSWALRFWTGMDDDGNSTYQMPLYFRQVRLEITYEINQPFARLREESNVGAHVAGRRAVWQTSGSMLSSFISASNDIHVVDTEESIIGRTFGIGLNTGSINQSNYALIYRLSGALADISGTAPGWLLNNQFGMPVIPLSSASLVEFVEEPIFSIHPQDILAVRPLLDGAQRLSDAARDAAPTRTRADYAADIAEDDEE